MKGQVWWWSLVAVACAKQGPSGAIAHGGRNDPDAFTVDWSFDHIQEGYDHTHRVDVFADGVKVAESPEQLQSVPGRLTFRLPPTVETLRVVDLALYEGTWEEHTVANDYSIDCLWEGPVPPSRRLELVFDIDAGTLVR